MQLDLVDDRAESSLLNPAGAVASPRILRGELHKNWIHVRMSDNLKKIGKNIIKYKRRRAYDREKGQTVRETGPNVASVAGSVAVKSIAICRGWW